MVWTEANLRQLFTSSFRFHEFSEIISREPSMISKTHLHIQHILLLLFTPLEFFTSVLADGFSLEFE